MTIVIGKKIRQLRQGLNLTQEELGRAVGVTAQAVSKWESATTMPDIQLLPALSVTLGVTIDALFDLTDQDRLDRITSMLDTAASIPDGDFQSIEQFLQEKIHSRQSQAPLLLAKLYNRQAAKYHVLAKPLAREALLQAPEKKAAHCALFDAEGVPPADWNLSNHWALIDFYKNLLRSNPGDTLVHRRLLDLLVMDGRAADMVQVIEALDKLEHTCRADYYRGRQAMLTGDLPRALSHWQHMVEEFPNDWLAWALFGDQMARLCRYDDAVTCFRRSIALQPSPQYTDSPQAIAQICEIQGKYSEAVEMLEQCLLILSTQWDASDGEQAAYFQREIQRVKEKMK